MSKYTVGVYETLRHTVVVEAEDTAEAATKAFEVIYNGPDDAYETESLGTQEQDIEIEEEKENE